MPPGEVSTVGDRSVGASDRKPRKRAHRFRRQLHAVLHSLLSPRIVLASAGLAVQQCATEVGVVDLAVLLLLELDQAAARATVAQAFPFAGRHLLQGLGAPERRRSLGSFAHRSTIPSRPAAREVSRLGTCAFAQPNWRRFILALPGAGRQAWRAEDRTSSVCDG